MDDRFKRRQPGNPRQRPTGKLPPRQLPAEQNAQEQPFMVRLDPNSKPGEFNFMVESPQELSARVPASGLTAEASGGIPPQLHAAVDEVLGFIYELDQHFERKGKKR